MLADRRRSRRGLLRAARLTQRAALVVTLTMGVGSVPEWRLSPKPPPALVLPVGDPVTPIDRPR